MTSVTYGREPILVQNADLLISSIESIQNANNFELIAQVILPDHWHCIIRPEGEVGVSSLLQRIKMSFGVKYRIRIGRRSGRVWQNRYWDHIIRDENDLNRHIDYIHYNPVKHGLVDSPHNWEYSSIHWKQFIQMYPNDWGTKEPNTFANADFGE